MELLSKASAAVALFLTAVRAASLKRSRPPGQVLKHLAPRPLRRTLNTSTRLRCKPWWTRLPANS